LPPGVGVQETEQFLIIGEWKNSSHSDGRLLGEDLHVIQNGLQNSFHILGFALHQYAWWPALIINVLGMGVSLYPGTVTDGDFISAWHYDGTETTACKQAGSGLRQSRRAALFLEHGPVPITNRKMGWRTFKYDCRVRSVEWWEVQAGTSALWAAA
jgi:hypothetical protein